MGVVGKECNKNIHDTSIQQPITIIIINQNKMAVEKPEPLKPLIGVSQEAPVLTVSQTSTKSAKLVTKPSVEMSAKKDPVIKTNVIDRKPPPIEPPGTVMTYGHT